jgi:hypothetical protein
VGIYDEQNRDWTISRRFLGDVKKAKAHMQLSNKILERVKGNLDLGANLGHGVKDTFVVDGETTIDIDVQPGVTNPTAKVTIQSGSVEIPELKGEEAPGSLVLCPNMPYGRPGARMFTQLFGHFRGETEVFDEHDLTVVASNNTNPFQDVPSCPAEDAVRFQWDFEREFMYAGEEVNSGWWNDWQVNLRGPDFINPDGPVPFVANAPCTFSGAYTPGGFVLSADEGLWVGTGRGGGCVSDAETEVARTKVITGQFSLGAMDLVSGEAAVVNRDFVAFNWTSAVADPSGTNVLGTPSSAGGIGEFEIVFAYIGDGEQQKGTSCEMAVGIFWGGEDGFEPWLFKDWLGIPIRGSFYGDCCLSNINTDQWHGPAYCSHWPWAPFQFGKFPSGVGTYLADGNNEAMVYIDSDGDRGSQPGNESGQFGINNSAQSWYNSRSFWFFLDAKGYVLEGQGGCSDGSPHLVFN